MKTQKMTFHHVGIPVNEKLHGGVYNEALKMSAQGYFDTPYAVEWMQFDDDNDLPEIIKTQPHVAYVVDDLLAALKGREIILQPNSPCDGVKTAFIKDGANLIELMQFDKPEQQVWPHPNKFLLECK
ncbi:VOC family protein [Neptunicella marina]|uniref:Uncharacterized protein n=1 Tax=Neptunicella marina TaxID=2125989 RepID=A0A8J6M0C3_9ALTE|nr:hypothetical protein [Neptunicella marina]MBC3767135.1 hypothetical protein [Neptunicella marina]